MSDDVQINIGDLMAAFATENATLAQRAVIAEQKVKAWQAEAERRKEEVVALRAYAVEQQRPAEEPAVEAVKAPARRRKATPG